MSMRVKVIYVWAGTQIVIGISLFVGTAFMAISLIPHVKNVVRQTSENLADAASALRGANESYCEVTTNSFSKAGKWGDTQRKVDDAGRWVEGLGMMLRSDAPLLNKFNGPGDYLRNLRKDFKNCAEAVQLVRDAVKTHYYDVHPQMSKSLNDFVVTLQDLSMLMQGGLSTKVCWYVCILGGLLSLLFVMNGMILVVTEKSFNNRKDQS